LLVDFLLAKERREGMITMCNLKSDDKISSILLSFSDDNEFESLDEFEDLLLLCTKILLLPVSYFDCIFSEFTNVGPEIEGLEGLVFLEFTNVFSVFVPYVENLSLNATEGLEGFIHVASLLSKIVNLSLLESSSSPVSLSISDENEFESLDEFEDTIVFVPKVEGLEGFIYVVDCIFSEATNVVSDTIVFVPEVEGLKGFIYAVASSYINLFSSSCIIFFSLTILGLFKTNLSLLESSSSVSLSSLEISVSSSFLIFFPLSRWTF